MTKLCSLSGWAAADDSLKEALSFTERFHMKGSFSPTCDRYGHILTGIGGSPQVMAPFVLPTAEEITLFPGGPGNGLASTRSLIEVAGESVRKADCPVLSGRAVAPKS